ncbi:Rosmarinate synthase [Nymphaea thermarum]|nr:Rosmarinate synthase [Nymphaea thermarum]
MGDGWLLAVQAAPAGDHPTTQWSSGSCNGCLKRWFLGFSSSPSERDLKRAARTLEDPTAIYRPVQQFRWIQGIYVLFLCMRDGEKIPTLVTAELPFPEIWLPLSNLDLLLPPIDCSIYSIYRKPSSKSDLSFGSAVEILKKSLAKVLVHYYPLAGEMVANSSDIEISGLKLHDPDTTVQGKLVPPKGRGVLSVQVTKLMCEGIIVACTSDHRIGDGYSIGMFMAAWAEVSRTNSLTLIPNFRRSLLSPRHPGSYDKSLDNMYVPLASLSLLPKHDSTSSDQFISRIYHLSGSALNQLQDLSSTDGTTRTKLEAFSGFLWKLIANANGDAESSCRLGIVVDGRSRLSEGPRSALYGYFGNVVSIPFGETTAEDLKSKPLGWAAKKVNKLLGCATNREHFQGLIDYVEGRRPNPMMTRIYYRGVEDGPTIVVSHARVFDPSKMDFCWGLPFFMFGHFPWGGDARFVLLQPSSLGNGDWVTKLMCKGIVVACTSNHRIGDAYTFGMFMATWAEVSRTNCLTLVPNCRCSLLSPCCPGSYDKSLDNMYPDLSSCVGALNQLQDPSSTNGTRRTKLEAFCAVLWKLMANASGDAESSCRLGIVVDGRSRLSEGPRSALFGYFGNVISNPFGEASIEDLKSKPLGCAAKKVNEFLAFATNREHFLGLIDYVEGKIPNPIMTRVCYRWARHCCLTCLLTPQIFPHQN